MPAGPSHLVRQDRVDNSISVYKADEAIYLQQGPECICILRSCLAEVLTAILDADAENITPDTRTTSPSSSPYSPTST